MWSSFNLRVGTPAQNIRVLISTAGQATWVLSPPYCSSVKSPACNQDGGGIFNSNKSQSWTAGSYNILGLESNLYPDDYGGSYGFDTVALGISNATKGPSLSNQVVAGIEASYWFFMGMFGLGSQPTNLTNFDNPHPSFLSTLKTRNIIPSLSWSYTAGAPYQLKGFFGSLVFGGYDRSRFIPNNVSFSLGPDISRDLVVGLQSITAIDSSGSNTSMLSSPILTFIDSTVPYIYLPVPACHAFEKTFGLIWDQETHMYLVDDKIHENLMKMNPNFTFTIGDSKESESTVDIVLPYASFDLVANPPLIKDTNTRYFPLKQAANDSQYTLGRTFLQESYLIMNYEHNNFSVFQSRFEDDLEEDIVAIPPNQLEKGLANKISASPPTIPRHNGSSNTLTTHTAPVQIHTRAATISISPSAATGSPTSNHTLPTTTAQSHSSGSIPRVVTAGIVFGTVAISIVGFLIVAFAVRRWRFPYSKGEVAGSSIADEALMKPEKPERQIVFSVQEIATNSICGFKEMPDSGKAELEGEGGLGESGRGSLEFARIGDSVIFRSSSHQDVKEIFMRNDSEATRRLAIYLSAEGTPSLWVRHCMLRISVNRIRSPQSGLPKSLVLDRQLPSTRLRNSLWTRRKSF